MRKIITAAFVSLDGVMQAPGGPDEDPTGGFEHGGWAVPHFDEALGAAMDETFAAAVRPAARPTDLRHLRGALAARAARPGRRRLRPGHERRSGARFDAITKYVATDFPGTLGWQRSQALGPDVVASLIELKAGDGPALLTQGSSALIQTLLANDLIDELRLLVFPLVLGKGKRLFGDGAIPAAFRLTRSAVSPSGVLIASYERAGEVRTGSFAMEQPTDAELERRAKLSRG